MRRAGLVLLALLVLLGAGVFVAKRYLLDTASVPPRSRERIELGELRGLARSISGALPVRINSELVGESTVPEVAVIAGGGFGPHPMVLTAYQVVYSDGSSVIIDTAMDRDLSDELSPDRTFYLERFSAVQEGMRKATAIVVTHEHPDHIGGISRTPFPDDVLTRVVLTREQAGSTEQLEASRFEREALEQVQVIDAERTHALAPGIVLIKAPGHTPGSLMVYVLLQDGGEFLFVGDIVWDMDNVTRLIGRPRLVTDYLLGELRGVVLEQIRMLHDFSRKNPDVHLVVSHDSSQYRSFQRSGRIGSAFE
jgi:glyoxylase-like metal-dependent hydrolase (beta-lactamase superfamily II)